VPSGFFFARVVFEFKSNSNFFVRNNLPERDGAGKSKFLPRNYAGYFDEKAKTKNFFNIKIILIFYFTFFIEGI
jgi:hypothetical protein